MHIVHLTSVHNSEDNRIRKKMLRSIVANGWKATLVTGDLDATSNDGVQIISVLPGNKQRLLRMFITAPLVVLKAFRIKADVYHLHDPELLLWAPLLALKGTPVIYDIHEDYSAALKQRQYLPKLLRNIIASVSGILEKVASCWCHIIVAEKYYRKRFPKALEILNYPNIEHYKRLNALDVSTTNLLYTGNISVMRGSQNLARLVADFCDISVTIVGYCPGNIANLMRKETRKNGSERLNIIGENRYLPFNEIIASYMKGCWLAGLALFQPTDHNKGKELTKFFEYMAVGLPIIASDFPVWRKLIEDQGVGLCVNPNDTSSIKCAVDWLRSHPQKAMEMGAKGQCLVKKYYNWQAEAKKLLMFYENIQK
jgi:glycosyltransferase involved in cell wall biosynthesis